MANGVGERYGWVPGDDAFTADLREEQPWLRDLHGKSVTELEILHGVLNNPEMAGRAFFYFRDPKYAASVPADKRQTQAPAFFRPSSSEGQTAPPQAPPSLSFLHGFLRPESSFPTPATMARHLPGRCACAWSAT